MWCLTLSLTSFFLFFFFLSANLALDPSDRMDLRNNQGGL